MTAKALRRFAFPDSIAARMALTVVLALLLTQAVSALLYLTDRSEGPPIHGPGVLIQRVTAIVQLVESTPQTDRDRLVGALDDPVLRIEWLRDRPAAWQNVNGGRWEGLRRRLRESMGSPARAILVEMDRRDGPDGMRRPDGPPPGDGPPPDLRRPFGPPPFPGEADERRWGPHVRLSVQLTDGTWLSFSGGDPLDGPFRLLRFALWMGGVVAVILALSLLAARRFTAPLAGFASAAERLGVGEGGEPLPETGPRELRAATRAFNRMQGRLARFVADRTQMLAAISHDLRTPLTRLRLRAELVDDPEMQRRMLADLDEMEAMIAATMAFARDDAKREPRGRLDLADLLQSLCDDRVDSGHDAVYDGPAHAVAEGRPVALRRAFANLMDNAIAYGGGFVIRLALEDGHARVAIDDNGPGIPVDEFEKVFAPFYRLERSRSRDTGGVGLGLSTARTIIRGHGGDIALENRAEGGLRVTVTLPR
jgi:signal transduction histidine kinase